MENWFETTMSNPDLLNDFYAKVNEEYNEGNENLRTQGRGRDNAWVRKRIYRKKMVRKFLSLNPSMKLDELYPLKHLNAIYIVCEDSMNDRTYNINHVTHTYIAPGGHVEMFRGTLEWTRNGHVFGIGNKDRDVVKITNRRIRHMKDEEELNYSFCKKYYSPVISGIL